MKFNFKLFFLLNREGLQRIGWAHLGTFSTGKFAKSRLGILNWSPNTIYPGLKKSRLNKIGGTDLHTLPTTNALFEKFFLTHRTWWSQEAVYFNTCRYGNLWNRSKEYPGDNGADQFPPAEIDGGTIPLFGRGQGDIQGIGGTIGDTIKTNQAI